MSERIPDDLSDILRRLTRAQVQVLQIMARYARQNRSGDVPSHYIQERYGKGTSVYNVLKSLMAMELVERVVQEKQRRVFYRLTFKGRIIVYIHQSMTNEQVERVEDLFVQRIHEYARSSDVCDGDENLANVFSRALARACRLIVLSTRSDRSPMLNVSELLDDMLNRLKSARLNREISNMIAVMTAYIISDRARSNEPASEHYRRLFSRIMLEPLDESIQWISVLLRVKYQRLARVINKLILLWIDLVRFLKAHIIFVIFILSLIGSISFSIFFCRYLSALY
jgi:DNA-binding MarR family transcriptional regulator